MKRAALILIVLAVLLCACGRTRETAAPVLSAPPTIASSQTAPANRTVRIAVTEMLGDTELFRLLCCQFEQQTGYRTDLSVNTDSISVSVAETGKMDLLIAQNGTDASRFLTAGYAVSSLDWVSDSMVLAGPKDDPAFVGDADTLRQAMIRIAKTGSAFVSRYDDSDLSRAEMRLWNAAGISIGDGKRWYTAARSSMLPSLQKANELDAYILSDKETFLQNRQSLDLVIFMQDTPDLQTVYCVMPLSSGHFPSVNAEGIEAWLDFIESDAVREFIQSYGTDSCGSPIYEVLN